MCQMRRRVTVVHSQDSQSSGWEFKSQAGTNVFWKYINPYLSLFAQVKMGIWQSLALQQLQAPRKNILDTSLGKHFVLNR